MTAQGVTEIGKQVTKPMTQLQANIIIALLILMVVTFFGYRNAAMTQTHSYMKVSCETQYLAAVNAMHNPVVKPWTDYLTGGRTPEQVLALPQCKDIQPTRVLAVLK